MAMSEQETLLFNKAKDKIVEQQGLLKQLTAPAYHMGIVLEVFDKTVVVETGGQVFELERPEGSPVLTIGQGVDIHPQTGQVVKGSKFVSYGASGIVAQIDDGGKTIMVNLPQGQVTVEHAIVPVAVGDTVVLNATNHVILKKIDKQSQYAFKTQSVLTWDDIGACEDAKRELISSLETPYVKKDVFAAFHKKQIKGALLWGRAGNGKLLDVNESIPTPTGWVRNGEIVDGDIIFDEVGVPTKVLAAHKPQYDTTYRIMFDDGSQIIAGGSHLWATSTEKERKSLTARTEQRKEKRRSTRLARNGKTPTVRGKLQVRPEKRVQIFGVRTTEEILSTIYIRGRANHSIDLCSPLELPDAVLPIDPYTFGYWLGDGGKHHGGFTIGRQDQKFVLSLFQLRALGVLDSKHIPMMYLRAGIVQRTALLQGLMDSDGHADQFGYCQWSSSHPPLVAGMSELLHSLGIKHEMCPKIATVRYKGRVVKCPTTRTTFSTAIQCFRLPRKARKQKTTGFNGCSSRRYIVRMERIEPRLMRCLTVDSPSHLYLAGRAMIPTHNTLLGRAAAGSLAKMHGKDGGDSGFIYIKGPEILDKFVGETESQIRQAFEHAKRHFKERGYPAVMFVDEADAIMMRRGSRTAAGMEMTIVPQFLSCMDGIEDSGVFVLLATNRADTLDPAVIRPGRIDRKIYVAPPTRENAPSIWSIHMRDIPVDKGTTKDQLIQTANDMLFSEQYPLYVIETASSKKTFCLGQLVSGALISGIVERASAIAIDRNSDAAAIEGLRSDDFTAALSYMHKEQYGMNHFDELREFIDNNKLEPTSIEQCHDGQKITDKPRERQVQVAVVPIPGGPKGGKYDA